MEQTSNVLKADENLGLVLYIGPDELLFSMIDSHLTEEFNFESLSISSGKALMSKTIRDAADLCFISAAALGDSSDVVGYCMALRQSKPDLPTILCSADVSMSDFSTERWEICDATLRIPLSRVATVLAVSAAIENNAGFVQKCIMTARWRDPDELMDPVPSEITEMLQQELAGGEA
jgi:hypothetical protein